MKTTTHTTKEEAREKEFAAERAKAEAQRKKLEEQQ